MLRAIFQHIVPNAKSIFRSIIFCIVCEVSVVLLLYLATATALLQPGSATMKMEVNSTDMNEITFSRSKCGIFYNIFLIGLVSFSYCVTFHYIFEERPLMTRGIDTKVKNWKDVCLVISAIYVLVIFSLRQQTAIEVAREIFGQKELFSRINRKSAMIKSIVFILIINIFFLIFTNIGLFHRSLVVNVYILVVVTSAYISYFVFLQYSLILEILKQFFELLNQDLQELSELGRVTFDENSSISNINEIRLSLDVEKIIVSYQTLVQLSKNISSFYSEPMLFCVMNTFVILVSSSYYISEFLIGVNQDLSAIAGLLGIFLPASSMVLILTTTAETTISESKKTGGIVYECLRTTRDPLEEQMLNRFSYYLLFTRIKFDVYDLFDLDASLLLPLIGAMTSYIVVVLQFSMNA